MHPSTTAMDELSNTSSHPSLRHLTHSVTRVASGPSRTSNIIRDVPASGVFPHSLFPSLIRFNPEKVRQVCRNNAQVSHENNGKCSGFLLMLLYGLARLGIHHPKQRPTVARLCRLST